MKKSVILSATLLTAMFAMNAQANQMLSFSKPIPASVVLNKQTPGLAMAKKEVYLMNINLTPTQKDKILQSLELAKPYVGKNDDKLPKKADLSMNGTPVLDQGRHGTCVTFAVTAAVDALLGRGDYVSQLCSLALGSQIEKNGYTPSGWDGSLGGLVLAQIQNFGIVSKDAQRASSCGGLTEYPVDDENTVSKPMPLTAYKALSENVGEEGLWDQSVLNIFKRFDAQNNFDGFKYVDKVREAIATPQTNGLNYRVVFATLLPVEHCSVGACGTHVNQFDTWVLSKEILKDKNMSLGGHEMVITGYDDKAVATDVDGKTHKGLFTLRNSWGTDVGNQGDYYMSYDFFAFFVMEVDKVIMPVE